MRLDIFIAQKFSYTRNKAQQFIEGGLIKVNKKVITKVSFTVEGAEEILLEEDKKIHWVSRSAGKLDGFFEQLQWEWIFFSIKGSRCLDIGSSTGGFTQILLERDAWSIDAIDVWSNQLDAIIRNNKKVTSYENTDIRNFPTPEKKYDAITIDVSFISLKEIIPELKRFSHENTEIFLLFKPQFEVGKENLRKTGVPKNEKIIYTALVNFRIFLRENAFSLLSEKKANVIGEAWNQEYMFFIKNRAKDPWHL